LNITVIGAGAMGAALALSIERAGQRVTICATAFDAPLVASLRRDGLSVVDAGDWEVSIRSASIVVVAVASIGVQDVVRTATKWLRPEAIWAVASKGWDSQNAQPLSAIIEKESPDHPVVMLAGPTLAAELAVGSPTALLCACRDLTSAGTVSDAIRSSSLSTFITDDVIGVEVGAALKNVLAVAVGMVEGIASLTGTHMDNAKAAVFSLGLVDMARLAFAMGGREDTVLGLAGAGDFFVTVMGGRNGTFGRLVGGGLDPRQALSQMSTTVEGYDSAQEAASLASRYGINLPVVAAVVSVLHGGVAPRDAIESLMRG